MVVRELLTKIGFSVNEQQLNQAENKVNMLSTRMKVGLAAAGAALLKIGVDAVSAAADMETLTAKFEVMLGSAEKATGMIEDLTQFAATTPFALEDLAKGSETLLQFGVSADKVLPTMRMLGDVAGDNRERMKSLALVFGQISSLGRLQGQDLLQLINQGFNPLNQIAKRTGESMTVLKDRMSDGQISAEMVTQAFKDATSEGGLFFKNMEKQSQTFNGLVSTMKDNFKLILIDMGKVLLPGLKELVKNFTEVAQGPLKLFIQDFSKFLQPIVEIVIEVIKTIVSIFIPIMQIVGKIFGFVGSIISSFVPVFEMLGTVINKFIESLKPIFKIFSDTLNVIQEALSPIIDLVVHLFMTAFTAILPIIEMLSSVMSDLGNLFTEVVAMIMPFITELTDLFMSMMPMFIEIINILIEALKPVFEIFFTIVGIVIKGLMPVFRILLSYFGFLIKMLSMVIQALMPVFTAVMGVVQVLLDALVPVFDAISFVVGIVVDALTPLLDLFGMLAPVLKFVGTIIKWILKPIVWVAQAIKWVIEKIVQLFTWISDWLKKIGLISSKGAPKKIKVDVDLKKPKMRSSVNQNKIQNIKMNNSLRITAKDGATAKDLHGMLKAQFSEMLQTEVQKIEIGTIGLS